MPEFIHTIAAMLEAGLTVENHPRLREWLHSRGVSSHRTAMTTALTSFFTDPTAFIFSRDNPDYRLPYLYSLAIALSYGVTGVVPRPLEVLYLVEDPGELREKASVERTLDTNALVVTILRLALPQVLTDEEAKRYLSQITKALRPLWGIIDGRDVHDWQTRWKSIYLLADIRSILPPQLAEVQPLLNLINDARDITMAYIKEQNEPVPYDWKMKGAGLRLCGLDTEVEKSAKRNKPTERVYSWRHPGNIPYLSLYPQRIQHDTASHTLHRLLERLPW